jgi:hypothetical protein
VLVRLFISAVIVCLIPFTASGQTTPEKSTAQQSNFWLQGFSTIRLDKHWSVPLEIHVRRAHTGLTWQALLIRGALVRDFNEHVSAGAGYGHVTSWPYGQFSPLAKFGEHRIYEHVLIKYKLGETLFEQRIRLEQRWIQSVDSAHGVALDEHFYQNRIRYRPGISVPLRANEKKPGGEPETFFFLNDEILFNFGHSVEHNDFDQNRFAFGIGQKLGKVTMQAGYLHQYLQRPDGRRFESNHTLTLSFTHNISLH